MNPHGLSDRQVAAWRWVWCELGNDEPMSVSGVRRLCEDAKADGDQIHRAWAETVLKDLGAER